MYINTCMRLLIYGLLHIYIREHYKMQVSQEEKKKESRSREKRERERERDEKKLMND